MIANAEEGSAGYEALAAAIILQAAADYQTARKILKGKGPKVTYLGGCRSESAAYILQEVEAFFRSRWFGVLCDIDPQKVLRHLKGY